MLCLGETSPTEARCLASLPAASSDRTVATVRLGSNPLRAPSRRRQFPRSAGTSTAPDVSPHRASARSTVSKPRHFLAQAFRLRRADVTARMAPPLGADGKDAVDRRRCQDVLAELEPCADRSRALAESARNHATVYHGNRLCRLAECPWQPGPAARHGFALLRHRRRREPRPTGLTRPCRAGGRRSMGPCRPLEPVPTP
jgi:hypothetical protein